MSDRPKKRGPGRPPLPDEVRRRELRITIPQHLYDRLMAVKEEDPDFNLSEICEIGLRFALREGASRHRLVEALRDARMKEMLTATERADEAQLMYALKKICRALARVCKLTVIDQEDPAAPYVAERRSTADS